MSEFVGIDVSARKLNIHFLTANTDYVIANDLDSINEFISQHDLSKAVIGCESTGRYHLLTQTTFLDLGYTFKLLNPILTSQKINHTVRKKKTDISDAKLIAQLLSMGEGAVVKNIDTSRRTVFRIRKTLVNHKASLKLLLTELKRDPYQQELEKCVAVIRDSISQLEASIKELEADSLEETKMTKEEKLINSIPGFAERLSAIVATEVGDFNRFPSSTQFKAFVGVDPRVKQSGNSEHKGKITKRGNPHLRSAFYLAAQVARIYDPELKAFYEKKKSEGKVTRVAIVAVARKLCERVFAVVKRGSDYEKRELNLV